MKKGITLIELLITISLISSIMIVTSSVYVTGFKTFKEELTSSIVQSNAQTILDGLTTDIKNGLQIEPTYTTYTTGEDMIIIRVPAVDATGHAIYTGSNMSFDRIIYYYKNNSIHKVIYADAASIRYPKNGRDVILDSKVLELQFAYDPDQASATLVTATISSKMMVGNRDKAITLTGQARLRNHI
jgi:prepilin-type N-terminal cleavage/methylation domain-containing protein